MDDSRKPDPIPAAKAVNPILELADVFDAYARWKTAVMTDQFTAIPLDGHGYGTEVLAWENVFSVADWRIEHEYGWDKIQRLMEDSALQVQDTNSRLETDIQALRNSLIERMSRRWTHKISLDEFLMQAQGEGAEPKPQKSKRSDHARQEMVRERGEWDRLMYDVAKRLRNHAHRQARGCHTANGNTAPAESQGAGAAKPNVKAGTSGRKFKNPKAMTKPEREIENLMLGGGTAKDAMKIKGATEGLVDTVYERVSKRKQRALKKRTNQGPVKGF